MYKRIAFASMMALMAAVIALPVFAVFTIQELPENSSDFAYVGGPLSNSTYGRDGHSYRLKATIDGAAYARGRWAVKSYEPSGITYFWWIWKPSNDAAADSTQYFEVYTNCGDASPNFSTAINFNNNQGSWAYAGSLTSGSSGCTRMDNQNPASGDVWWDNTMYQHG